MNYYLAVWFIANLADACITAILYTKYGVGEVNPIASYLFRTWGFWASAVFLKGVAGALIVTTASVLTRCKKRKLLSFFLKFICLVSVLTVIWGSTILWMISTSI